MYNQDLILNLALPPFRFPFYTTGTLRDVQELNLENLEIKKGILQISVGLGFVLASLNPL